MPPAALLAPIAIPVVAGLIAVASSRLSQRVSQIVAAAGVWAALVTITGIWIAVRSTQELSLGPLGIGVGFDLRLDGIAVVFGVIAVAPAAVLLTMQPRGWQESTVASLAVAAAILAIESGNLILTAVGGCTAATLAVVQLDIEDVRALRPSWALVMTPWLALVWAGVTLQIVSGTASYAAIPVAALSAPVFVLIAVAALLGAGMVPWRGWQTNVWTRPSLRGAGVTVATLLPLGLYLLVRAYEIGDGRYPQSWQSIALAAWGILVALGAAARAQAAANRSGYMAETVPGIAGFALMSMAVGTALGLFAAIVLLTSAALVIAALPLLPDRRGAAGLLVTAAAAGVPPGLAFVGRVLGLVAAFEAGNAFGLIATAGAATWLLSAAGAARSVGLTAGRRRQAPELLALVATVLGALVLAAGPAVAALAAMAADAISAVIPLPTGGLGPDAASIVTESTALPAVALFLPLLLLGAAAIAFSRPAAAPATAQSKAPLFELPGAAATAAFITRLRAWRVPEEYRSIFGASALETAAAGAQPALWIAALLALAIAITR